MAWSQVHRALWALGLVLVIVTHITLGLLSDYKICGDSCESPMSRVQAIRDFSSRDCRFLSFRRGDTIFVYHKLTGKREDLWAGSIDKQFGYFPKDVVQEEEVHATRENVLETQKSDFFCLDEFGYPIDSSHLDSDNEDDSNEKIKTQETDSRSTPPYDGDTNSDISHIPEDVSAGLPPTSTQEADGASTEKKESKISADAAEVSDGQGGSASSAWLGSTVTGWLGRTAEEADKSAKGEDKEESKETQAEESLMSSVTGWMGWGDAEKPDDAVKSNEEDRADSLASTVTGWLGFGSEKEADRSAEETQDDARESNEPAEKFRSRRMSLDLEGSQLHEEEEEEMGTLNWLGNGLSNTLGFGLTNQEQERPPEKEAEETMQEEEQSSSSWFNVGIGDMLGFRKDKSESGESVGSGLKETEGDMNLEQPTGSENVDSSQSHAVLTEEIKTERSNELALEEVAKSRNPEIVPGSTGPIPADNDDIDALEGGEENASKDATSKVSPKDIAPQNKLEEKSQGESGISSALNSHFQTSSGEDEDEEADTVEDNNKEENDMEDEDDQTTKSLENEWEDKGKQLGEDEIKSATDESLLTKSDNMLAPDLITNLDSTGGSVVEVEKGKTDVPAEESHVRDDAGESSEESEPFLSEEGEKTSVEDSSSEFRSSHDNEIPPEIAPDEDRGLSTNGHMTQVGEDADQDMQHSDSDTQMLKETEKDDDGNLTLVQTETAEEEELKEEEQGEVEELNEEREVGTKQEVEGDWQGEEEEAKKEEEQEEVKEMEVEEKMKELQREDSQDREKEEGSQWEEEVLKDNEKRDEMEEIIEEKKKQEEVDELEREDKDWEEEDITEEGQKVKMREEKGEKREGEEQEEGSQREEEILKDDKKRDEMEEIIEDKKKQEEEDELEREDRDQEVEDITEEGEKENMRKEKREKREVDVQEVDSQREEEVLKDDEKSDEMEEIVDERKHEEMEGEEKKEKQQEALETKEGEENEEIEEITREEKEEVKEMENQMEGGILKGVKDKVKENTEERLEELGNEKEIKGEAGTEGDMKELKEGDSQREEEVLEDDEKTDEVVDIMEENIQEEVEDLESEDKDQETKEIMEEGGKENIEESVEEERQEEVGSIEEMTSKGWKEEVKGAEVEEIKAEKREEEGELKGEEKQEELEQLQVKQQQIEESKEERWKDAEDFREEESGEDEDSQSSEFEVELDIGSESEGNEEEAQDEINLDSVVSKTNTETEGRELEIPEIKEEKREEENKDQEEEIEVKNEMKQVEVEEIEEEDGDWGQDEEESLRNPSELGTPASEDELLMDADGNDSTSILSSLDDGETEEDEQNLTTDRLNDTVTDTTGVSQALESGGVEAEEEGREEQGGGAEDDEGVKSWPESKEDYQLCSSEERHMNLCPQGDKTEPEDSEGSREEISPEKETEQERSSHQLDTEELSDRGEREMNLTHDDGSVNDVQMKTSDGDTVGGELEVTSDFVNSEAVVSEPAVPADGLTGETADTERSGAFGMFTHAFSYFTKTPVTETKESIAELHPDLDPQMGKTSEPQDSLAPELDSTDYSSQSDIQDSSAQDQLQPSPHTPIYQTSTPSQVPSYQSSPPSNTGSPFQTKPHKKHEKNLLVYLSVEEMTTLTGLFGHNKMQFLDFILGSLGTLSDDPGSDESILLDIESLLHYHRDTLLAPTVGHVHTPLEDTEKTRTLIALEKLETLLAGVRETFNTGKADISSTKHQATDSRDIATEEELKMGDSSAVLNNNIQREEWMRADKEKDEQLSKTEDEKGRERENRREEERVDPEFHPHAQPGPAQSLEGEVKKILDFVHQLAQDSLAHILAVRELLIWLTVQSIFGSH